jgi:hypothetical protein
VLPACKVNLIAGIVTAMLLPLPFLKLCAMDTVEIFSTSFRKRGIMLGQIIPLYILNRDLHETQDFSQSLTGVVIEHSSKSVGSRGGSLCGVKSSLQALPA